VIMSLLALAALVCGDELELALVLSWIPGAEYFNCCLALEVMNTSLNVCRLSDNMCLDN
jgi:hypothetical protein